MSRTYGQYCGVARALELVGERWALLIVRDLLVGPRRFTDLRRELPRIPSNILTTRLREMEEAGLVRRVAQPRPAGGVAYELTPYGQRLDEIVGALGRWGAASLPAERGEAIATPESMTMALRSTFDADAARDVHASFVLRTGPIALRASVDGGALSVRAAEPDDPAPDLTITATGPINPLLSGAVSPDAATRDGLVILDGPGELLPLFVRLFPITPRPD